MAFIHSVSWVTERRDESKKKGDESAERGGNDRKKRLNKVG
jgi:hypothetical protein